MKNALAIVHVGPAVGARFTEYTVEFEAQGELGPAAAQRFLYVLEGALLLEAGGKGHELGARGYAYLGQGLAHRAVARQQSRVAVIEKHYVAVDGVSAPRLVVSSED